MNRLIIIHPNGGVLVRKQDTEPSFEAMKIHAQMRADVTLEHVNLRYEDRRSHIFINEDGRIEGLPLNRHASIVLAGYNNGRDFDFVGPVIIWTGDVA